MHDRICVMNKGTMIRLSHNTNDGASTKRNQYGGTGVGLNVDMRTRVTKNGWGSNPTKLGRWTWTRIRGKDGITTVFVLAYRPCHSPTGIYTVWRQQARYFKENEDTLYPDVHALFIRDLSKFLGDLRDDGNNVVLGRHK